MIVPFMGKNTQTHLNPSSTEVTPSQIISDNSKSSSSSGRDFSPMDSESSFTSNDSDHFETAPRSDAKDKYNISAVNSKVTSQREFLSSYGSPPHHKIVYNVPNSPSSFTHSHNNMIPPNPPYNGADPEYETSEEEEDDDDDDDEDDEEEEEEEEEEDEEEEEEEEDDDENENTNAQLNPSHQHPYYEQWRQYYAQMALQHQMMSSNNPQAMYKGYMQQYGSQFRHSFQNPSNTYPYGPSWATGSNPMLTHSRGSSNSNSSEDRNSATENFPKSRRSSIHSNGDFVANLRDRQPSFEGNKLVERTRQSATKAKRFPSLPSSISESKSPITSHRRVSSLNIDVEYQKQYNEDNASRQKGSRIPSPQGKRKGLGRPPPPAMRSEASSQSLPKDSSDLQLHEDFRHISDYSKYFFEDDESNISGNGANGSNEPGVNAKEGSWDSAQGNFPGIEAKSDAERNFEAADSGSIGHPKESYITSSISQQNVDATKRRQNKRNTKSTLAGDPSFIESPYGFPNRSSFSPVGQLPPAPFIGPPPFGLPFNAMDDQIGKHYSRHSMATVDDKRLSLAMNQINGFDHGTSSNNGSPVLAPGGAISFSNDALINKKIINFLKLRQTISEGKKSFEYRLRWAKMLVEAVNYRFYTYINVKGQKTHPDQASSNKALFVKSAINHIVKLVRDSEQNKIDNDIAVEVFNLYACLLKHDYFDKYIQDFNIEKDISQSINYFEKCVDLNPNDFKSLYKLGEIYEFEYSDQFDKALVYYKTAAKIGYNRAIYRIALLYLNVEAVRSLKFLKYLTQLSNIEPKQAHLDPDDQEELQEVVGLACFELGKIYEGIYPGDLTAEDSFIQQALERVPVNYGKSLTCYNKAAKLSCLLAQVKLGTVYEYGDLNRQRNPNKSVVWYLKSSCSPLPFMQHPDAMLGLSRWYLVGIDKESKYIKKPDQTKALYWCDKAIKEFETPEAYYHKGYLAELGVVDSDPKVWYSKAYELGHPEAASKLE